jgi:calpain-15
MTGDPCESWMIMEGELDNWRQCHLVHNATPDNKSHARSCGLRPSGLESSGVKLFDILKLKDQRRSVIAAGTRGKGEGKSAEGIVAGHAYTVVSVIEAGGFKLLRLRNPWGSFEWKGDWSDESPLWAANPKLQKACEGGGVAKDDGFFWMSWADFASNFTVIDICDRSTGLNELALDYNEEAGCVGPLLGCLKGCATYWSDTLHTRHATSLHLTYALT